MPNRVRELREAKGLSARARAKETGLSHSTIARIENGERKISTAQAQAIAAYFGVTTDYLLKWKPQPEGCTFNRNPHNRIKELREASGLTVRELAARTEIDFATISFIEKDQRAMTVKNLLKFCEYFGVSADYILGLTKDEALPMRLMPEMQPEPKAPEQAYFRDRNGYVMVYMPESPMAGKNGWAYLHRVVMAKAIGRDLRPGEVVHHIDGNPKNNNRSNLMFFANNAEHRRYHGQQKRDQEIQKLLNQ